MKLYYIGIISLILSIWSPYFLIVTIGVAITYFLFKVMKHNTYRRFNIESIDDFRLGLVPLSELKAEIQRRMNVSNEI